MFWLEVSAYVAAHTQLTNSRVTAMASLSVTISTDMLVAPKLS